MLFYLSSLLCFSFISFFFLVLKFLLSFNLLQKYVFNIVFLFLCQTLFTFLLFILFFHLKLNNLIPLVLSTNLQKASLGIFFNIYLFLLKRIIRCKFLKIISRSLICSIIFIPMSRIVGIGMSYLVWSSKSILLFKSVFNKFSIFD